MILLLWTIPGAAGSGFGQRVLGRLLGHPSRLQLLDKRRGLAAKLGSKLGDGGHGHKYGFLGCAVQTGVRFINAIRQ